MLVDLGLNVNSAFSWQNQTSLSFSLLICKREDNIYVLRLLDNFSEMS